VVARAPTVQKAAEKELGGEARGATPAARGLEVRNSFRILIGWLEPEVKTETPIVERQELSSLLGAV